mgnify:CR=1 FL=1
MTRDETRDMEADFEEQLTRLQDTQALQLQDVDLQHQQAV